MGLYCSHGAFDASYSCFNRWRKHIAFIAGLPPLELMEGFYEPFHNPPRLPTLHHGNTIEWNIEELDNRLPIKWECLIQRPLLVLLNHCDCDGIISPEDCGLIAHELEGLLPLVSDEWKLVTEEFIDGCKSANSQNENLEFR